MTAAAWWMMALVCGFVWGGFVLLLARALRHEGRKVRDGVRDGVREDRPGGGPA